MSGADGITNSISNMSHPPNNPNTVHCHRIRRNSSLTTPSVMRRGNTNGRGLSLRQYCCMCGTTQPRKPSIHRVDAPKEIDWNHHRPHHSQNQGPSAPGHSGSHLPPPSNGIPSSSTITTGTKTDMGDVVLKLMDVEKRFENRKRFKSMFTDEPIYQDLEENNLHPHHNIAKVSPSPTSPNTNVLDFDNRWFCPIDSDINDPTTWSRSNPADAAHTTFDRWKDNSKNGQTSPIGSPSDRDKPSSPTVIDRRSRPQSPLYHSVGRPTSKKPIYRSPSDPTEMKTFIHEIAGTGPNRAMWYTMPQTKDLVTKLSTVQKKQQEALFEILTSEASYYRSLTILIDTFYKAPSMLAGNPGSVITPMEKHHLFSNVLEIHMTSENFLRAMEMCFRKDPWMINLFEIVYEHTERNFHTYETYVQNQMYQTRTLTKLQQHQTFSEAVRQIKSQSECEFLDLNSFLLMPMQRVTRMRLLASTVLKYAIKNTNVYKSGLVALAALELFLEKCDAKKSYMEQKERLMGLTMRFEYKFDAKSVATESRRLIKEGELRLLGVNRQMGSTFQRRLSSIRRTKLVHACLFLFNDLLVIAKKRRNDHLMVDDSCELKEIRIRIGYTPQESKITRYYQTDEMKEQETSPIQSTRNASNQQFNFVPHMSAHDTCPFTFNLIIEGPDHPRAEYKLQAKSISERERWIDALKPTKYVASNELLIRDCPQLLVTRSYSAIEDDELEMKEGDGASLLISLDDGWCKGMVHGGRKGWFPDNICMKVDDATAKREQMENCHLIEHARAAYKKRKTQEKLVEFQTVGELRNARMS